MFNMVRTGVGVALGLADGAADTAMAPPFVIGGVSIDAGSVVDVAGLAVGVGLQALAPMTAPNAADGLIDTSAALLARRIGVLAVHVVNKTPITSFAQTRGPAHTAQRFAAYGGVHNGALRGVQTAFKSPFNARVG